MCGTHRKLEDGGGSAVLEKPKKKPKAKLTTKKRTTKKKKTETIKRTVESKVVEAVLNEDTEDTSTTETEPEVLDTEEAIQARVTEILAEAATEEDQNGYIKVNKKKEKAKAKARNDFHFRVIQELAQVLPGAKPVSRQDMEGNAKSKTINLVRKKVQQLFAKSTLPAEAPVFIDLYI